MGSIYTPTSARTSVDVEHRALAVATRLHAAGVSAGDRVLLRAANSADYVVALLALMHLDTSIVLLDHRETATESDRVRGQARVRWTVTDNPGDAVPADTFDLAGLLAAPTEPDAGPEFLSFQDWNNRKDALITWSSGSTGQPKGIVRSGWGFLSDLERTRERMEYHTGDVLLPMVPFSHFYGLTLVILSWTIGCSLAIPPQGRLDQAIRLAGQVGATVVDATPSTYHSLLNLVDRRPEILAEFSQVRMFCVGGAPLSSALAKRFQRVFGRPLLDGYGSNEAGNVALASLANPTGCGRALSDVEISIVDPDGRPVATGETGEILVRSPSLMEGYLAADGSVTPVRQPYRTDDLGHRDADGNLTVVGRRYAVHNLGHTLYPEAIERKAEVCGQPLKIIAIEDERRGSQLVCFVEDPAGGSSQHWRRAICALLPSYEHPSKVLVLPALPLNANGKPDLGRLRQLALEALPRVGVHVAPASAAPGPDGDLVAAPGRWIPSTDIPFPDRIGALRATAEFLRDDPDPVLEVLTRISVRKAAQLELEGAIETLTGAVEEIDHYQPPAVAEMAVFMPSNVLLYSYILYLMVPALYTRHTVFRPSSQVAPETAALHEVLGAVHGLPIELTTASQRKFVEGPVAQAEVVAFTGTYQNAETIRAGLTPEQVFMLFGQGVNPFVVAPEADLDLALGDAVRIRMLNSGQDCFGPDVFYVPQDQLESFVEGLTKRLAALNFGNYTDPDTDYGPIFYGSAMQAAVDYLSHYERYILHGGQIDFRTRQIQPTVLVRGFDDENTISELFSPIFNVVGYDDLDQLGQRLTSPFFQERAMGAMVYGEAPALVERLAKRHTVAVDQTLLEVDDGNRPFGGRGVMANYVSHRKSRRAEPLLISKVVADELTERA